MAKKATRPSLRELALAPLSGFRSKDVDVPEWGCTVTIREPSAQAWLEWRQSINPEVTEGEEPKKLTPAQEANRNLQSDVFLFIDILLDEEKTQVFTLKDKGLVESIYGPVHARLLSQALALGASQAETEKKPETPAPSS